MSAVLFGEIDRSNYVIESDDDDLGIEFEIPREEDSPLITCEEAIDQEGDPLLKAVRNNIASLNRYKVLCKEKDKTIQYLNDKYMSSIIESRRQELNLEYKLEKEIKKRKAMEAENADLKDEIVDLKKEIKKHKKTIIEASKNDKNIASSAAKILQHRYVTKKMFANALKR